VFGGDPGAGETVLVFLDLFGAIGTGLEFAAVDDVDVPIGTP
jgi:hypothetical protein